MELNMDPGPDHIPIEFCQVSEKVIEAKKNEFLTRPFSKEEIKKKSDFLYGAKHDPRSRSHSN